MIMTHQQALITIAICALATALTRFVPFLLFPTGKKLPPLVQYLSDVLPYAVIGLLVVYCLKGVSIFAMPHGLPEATAIALVIAVHVWRRNVLLSIAAGTIAYMLLVQFVWAV